MTVNINLQFRDESLASTDFREILIRLQKIVRVMAKKTPKLETWYAQGDSLKEAYLYRAFEHDAPSEPLLAVLRQRFKGPAGDFTYVSLWNGEQSLDEGATLSCHVGNKVLADSVDISLYADFHLGDVEAMADVVRAAVAAFNPAYVSASPYGYIEKQVFDDRPGVGWMLYLPRVLTVQQVPEAHALIPIPEAGKRQVGTLIVSEIDGVFSLDNPAHVLNANQIEIRLVDQDLLPLYAEI